MQDSKPMSVAAKLIFPIFLGVLSVLVAELILDAFPSLNIRDSVLIGVIIIVLFHPIRWGFVFVERLFKLEQ